LLVGSGLRISEAIALQLGDLELEDSGGVIVVYRSRKKGKVGSTKSDRFRAVEIGPLLSTVVHEQVAKRARMAGGDRLDALLNTMPVRVRKTDRGAGRAMVSRSIARPSRATGTRRCCRTRTCATCRCTRCGTPRRRGWRAALSYVPDQLGHGDIRTTERYYGHLERHVKEGAKATEAAIARAVREHNGRRRSGYAARPAPAGTR
jgi:integrase